jgi:dCMP deaminase
MAKIVSTRSTCSSRPVGCVIVRENRVLVTGYNGAPPGEPHCVDLGKDGELYCHRRSLRVPDQLKFPVCRSLHAEANALALAEKLGLSERLKGAVLYSTLSPCVSCAKALASRGIAKVYYELAYRSIDAERDREWEKLARDSFEVYENLQISPDSLAKIAGSILGVTSERLLPSE